MCKEDLSDEKTSREQSDLEEKTDREQMDQQIQGKVEFQYLRRKKSSLSNTFKQQIGHISLSYFLISAELSNVANDVQVLKDSGK